ncbi:MAG TPA: hypothetical protein VHI71_08760 [Actinomycetota bacterium]|nr:hypothetical protein [Actinomycetota bacterium]
MRYVIEVPPYSRQDGLEWEWDSEAYLLVRASGSEIHVRGDSVGLRNLAEVLLTLAQEGVPDGVHVHLDTYTSLTEGSSELLLERSSGSSS